MLKRNFPVSYRFFVLGFFDLLQLEHFAVLLVVLTHSLELSHTLNGSFIVLRHFLLSLVQMLKQQLKRVQVARYVLMDHV